MKKILMLGLLLVVAFANVDAAKAEPMAFGAASFDDKATLFENLNSIIPSGATLQQMDPRGVLGINPAYIALVAVSQTATSTQASSAFNISGASGTVANAFEMNNYWKPVDESNVLADLQVSWSNGITPVENSLTDIINGLVSGVKVSGAYLYANDMVYTPEGFDSLVLSGGIIFIGLDLGLGNEVDAIIAISPMPINAVPVPAAVWLLGSGLAGIVALRKRMN